MGPVTSSPARSKSWREAVAEDDEPGPVVGIGKPPRFTHLALGRGEGGGRAAITERDAAVGSLEEVTVEARHQLGGGLVVLGP